MYTTSLDRSLAFQHSWRLPQGKTNTPRGSLLQWLALVSTVSHRLRSIVQRKHVFLYFSKTPICLMFFQRLPKVPMFLLMFSKNSVVSSSCFEFSQLLQIVHSEYDQRPPCERSHAIFTLYAAWTWNVAPGGLVFVVDEYSWWMLMIIVVL